MGRCPEVTGAYEVEEKEVETDRQRFERCERPTHHRYHALM